MDYPLIIISACCFAVFAAAASLCLLLLCALLLRVGCGTGLTTGACDGIQCDAGRDGSVQ